MKPLCALLFLLLALSAHAATVTLTWQDNSDNEDGFRLEQSEIGQPWAVVATTGPDATSADTDIDTAKLYCWRVSAFNAAGQSLPSDAFCLLGRATITGIRLGGQP